MPTIDTTVVPLPGAEALGRSEQGFVFDGTLIGKRQRTRIAGTINGHPFATGANPMGDGTYFVFLNAAMRAATGLSVGDAVTVAFVEEDARPELSVPDDLAAALQAAGVRGDFETLPWSHRKRYIEWIDEAVRPGTRAGRIAKAAAMIADRTNPF